MATQPTASTMFSSVMDMFKSKPAAPKVDGAPAANPTVPSDGTPQSDGKGPKAIPAAGTDDASPLAGYKDLWEHADTDGKPIALVPPLEADPAKLLAAAKTVDFTKTMNPELLEKAAKGDAAALSQVVNEAAQAGYAQSAMATTKILEAALAKQADMFKTTVMPEILRRNNIGNALRADNPLFDNPAVKPLLEGLEARLVVKYPTDTPEQLNIRAKEIFLGMSEELVKASGRQIVDAGVNSSGVKEEKAFDWEAHFLGKKQA